MNEDARLTRVAASHPLDAMNGAADHHRALLENETVGVLDTRVAPGQQAPVHGHEWSAALYVLSWSSFVRYDTSGSVLLGSRTMSQKRVVGSALWSAPIGPHYVENVGPTELRILAVEVKA